MTAKLRSLKLFLKNLASKGNIPDIVVVVETHISDVNKNSLGSDDLTNIVPGYMFFHKSRKTMRGGGVGVFVSCNIKAEAKCCEKIERNTRFIDGEFENISVT